MMKFPRLHKLLDFVKPPKVPDYKNIPEKYRGRIIQRHHHDIENYLHGVVAPMCIVVFCLGLVLIKACGAG